MIGMSHCCNHYLQQRVTKTRRRCCKSICKDVVYRCQFTKLKKFPVKRISKFLRLAVVWKVCPNILWAREPAGAAVSKMLHRRCCCCLRNKENNMTEEITIKKSGFVAIIGRPNVGK